MTFIEYKRATYQNARKPVGLRAFLVSFQKVYRGAVL